MANSIGAYIQLRENEDKLQTLNNQMKKFIGFVAHDLRNPIGSIISLARLGDKSDDIGRIKRILSRIAPAAEEALELVVSILEKAALGTGKIELTKSPSCPLSIAKEAVESVAELLIETDKTIKIECPHQGECLIDAKRIQQVLNNLLINAIKYSPQKACILIKIDTNSSASVFTVQNQIGSTDSKNSALTDGSVGFGLEIVKEILKAHGSELKGTQSASEYKALFSLANQ